MVCKPVVLFYHWVAVHRHCGHFHCQEIELHAWGVSSYRLGELIVHISPHFQVH